MEKDFKLCENEGLFQEYLEMGKLQLYTANTVLPRFLDASLILKSDTTLAASKYRGRPNTGSV